ncbi:hypothetical protein A3K86_19750 [Photobacterium jeanii]|uniref:Uncharacterized protein n=2 Tax=Photobacterium jeanii TaxID=858640 RepID=A0A178K338_9GAMM|nr:hypothetical protein A3K86_19750 [Photobacterium jeanii]PST91235.1 hypothetical protein C9I91_08850 [Photobacterium jeanii]
MQSGRTPHTKQLVYRQVDVNRQMAVFLNTTYNGYFLFTFVKSAPCSASSSYDAMLTVNGEADQPVSFQCQTPNTAIYRIAEPKFTQLKLVNSDFSFDISEQKWPFKALKKDDFMQRNYHFFKGRTKEPLYPWNRD